MLTIEEIRDKIAPVAIEYGLRQVYLFGSYARGEANEDSDVDLVGGNTNNLWPVCKGALAVCFGRHLTAPGGHSANELFCRRHFFRRAVLE